MPRTMTLEEKRVERQLAIEGNRALGVQEWENGEKQSDRIFEVEEGYHRVPVAPGSKDFKTLGPGHRFHPTEEQAELNKLRGKARELTETELRGIHRTDRKPVSPGADIGLRALPMAEGTVRLALDQGLTEADFNGVAPEGRDGQYTRSQVEAIIEARERRTMD